MVTTQFLTAGKAIFTATNTKRNTRLTFKIEKPETFRGEFFAQVMKGRDNETDYSYVGMVKEGTFTLRETKGSKYRKGSAEFDGLKLVLDIVAGRRPATPLLDIQHAGKCGRCMRTLTVPESIESGIGPECAEKMGIAVAARVTKPVSKPVAKPEPEPVDLPLVAVEEVVAKPAVPAAITSDDMKSLTALAAKLEAARKDENEDEHARLVDYVGF